MARINKKEVSLILVLVLFGATFFVLDNIKTYFKPVSVQVQKTSEVRGYDQTYSIKKNQTIGKENPWEGRTRVLLYTLCAVSYLWFITVWFKNTSFAIAIAVSILMFLFGPTLLYVLLAG